MYHWKKNDIGSQKLLFISAVFETPAYNCGKFLKLKKKSEDTIVLRRPFRYMMHTNSENFSEKVFSYCCLFLFSSTTLGSRKILQYFNGIE